MASNKAVRNERRKLTATLLNNSAAAALGVGGLTQAAALVNGAPTTWMTPYFIVICITLGLVLHWLGRRALAELEE